MSDDESSPSKTNSRYIVSGFNATLSPSSRHDADLDLLRDEKLFQTLSQSDIDTSCDRLYNSHKNFLQTVEEKRNKILPRPKTPKKLTADEIEASLKRLHDNPVQNSKDREKKLIAEVMTRKKTKPMTEEEQTESVDKMYYKRKDLRKDLHAALYKKYVEPALLPKKVRSEEEWQTTVDRLYTPPVKK